MSWRACKGWITHLPVRSTLLVALLALGGWGMLTAVIEVGRAYEAYRQSQNVIVWARTTNHLFRMAQHFAFERGRMAVVLRAPQPISTENREFLDRRRSLADQAMQDFLRDQHLLPPIGQEALVKQWEGIQALRLAADRNAALPLIQRDPQLAGRWFADATQLLTDSRKLSQLLVSSYVRHRGLELARLTLVTAYAFELRLTLGAESALIAQTLASGKHMDVQELGRVHELRGKENMVWDEIHRLQRYAPIPGLDSAIDVAWREHQEVLRPQQSQILAAWAQQQQPNTSLKNLVTTAQPALDRISALMQLAAIQIEQLALQHKQQALQTLLSSLAACTAILAVMLLAIWYVLHKVVKPMERLDAKLRALIDDKAIPYPGHPSNEIACLEASTELVAHLWQEKSRLEGELRSYAFQDSLTLLPNRRLLMERIQQARVRNERRDQFACLLFLDLDKFKQVNDSHGHEIGDQLLIAVAKRLQKLLREEDTIARLGGDEFIVLLDNLGSDKAAAHTTATNIRDKLQHAMAQPYELEGMQLSCSVSIGYRIFHGSEEEIHTLIRDADTAMYHSKNEREGGCAVIGQQGLPAKVL